MAKPLADSFTSLLSHRPLNLLVRICALAAAGLCGWLVYLKLTGSISSVVGCGGADGCAQVLGGRWSQWLGIPVSLLAFLFYTFVFLLTLDPVQRSLGLQADRLLIGATFLSIFCAFWFVGLLWLVEKTFCPYCAAAHTMGLIFAIPVLISAWRRRLKSAPGYMLSAGLAAVPAMIILILGQVFGPAPQTYEIKETTLAPSPVVSIEPATELKFFNGSLTYKPKDLPLLGSPTAKYMLVEYFDYTCASCRDMHSDFDLVKTKRSQDIALIVLPCPLSRSCNPHLAPEIKDHPGACELAKFALAIWRRAPSQFPDYHHFLMRLPLPVNVDLAKKQAQKLLGSESALQIALSDPWIGERLTTTFNEYRQLSEQDRKMPKLLLGGSKVMTGQATSPEAFLELINREFPAS